MNSVPIKGCKDYLITRNGDVVNRYTRRKLKFFDNCGYWCIQLRTHPDGLPVKKKVHRLIAEAFVPPYHGQVVDHIDRDRKNNSIDNLRWVTHAENMANKGSKGTKNHSCVCKCGLTVSVVELETE